MHTHTHTHTHTTNVINDLVHVRQINKCLTYFIVNKQGPKYIDSQHAMTNRNKNVEVTNTYSLNVLLLPFYFPYGAFTDSSENLQQLIHIIYDFVANDVYMQM